MGPQTGWDDAAARDADRDAERAVGVVLSRVAELLAERASHAADATLADDIATESRPAVHALRDAMLAQEDGADGFEPHGLDHHEGLAMVHLLGRRAALIGATPATTTGLVDVLRDALAEVEERTLPMGFVDRLREACVEGFVRGREEALRGQWSADAAGSLLAAPFAAGCWWLSLAGDHEPEVVAERARAFGRELFSAEARAAVLDLRGLRRQDRSMAAAVLEAVSAAQTVGAVVHLAGVDAAWSEHLTEFGAPGEQLHPTLAAALDAALASAGLEVRPRLGARIRKLLPGSRQ